MSAVEKGPSHLNVAKAMMRRDPTLVSLKLESGMTVIHWALEKDQHRDAFFKVDFCMCFCFGGCLPYQGWMFQQMLDEKAKRAAVFIFHVNWHFSLRG